MREIDHCYLLLGLQPGASAEAIKLAYREAVRKWHPDQMEQGTARQRRAEEKLKAINLAYARLQAEAPIWATEAAFVGQQTGGGNAAYSPDTWARSTVARTAGAPDDADRETNRSRALSLFYEGQNAFRAGNWPEAISALLQSVYLAQNNPDAYFTLGLAYQRQNQLAKAESAFKQALRLGADPAETRYELGCAYIQCGDLAAAREQLAHLDKLDEELAARLRQVML